MTSKQQAEVDFWKRELGNYINWYDGKIEVLHGCQSPKEHRKITKYDHTTNAAMTWAYEFQYKKYLEDLCLKKDVFTGLKVLDIGSGPFPSVLAFTDCTVFGLDELILEYIKIGFPDPSSYETRFTPVVASAEKIPFPDNYFDVVICVNALDHVNKIEQVTFEMRRVLKREGKIALHVHYHNPSVTEPTQLSAEIMPILFTKVKGFKLKNISYFKDMGATRCSTEESYAVWSNL
jgi:ubiquinone/menaquinone biosynthesis C-methylase UbiE